MKKITIVILSLGMFFTLSISTLTFGESKYQKTKKQYKASTTKDKIKNDDNVLVNWESYKNKKNRIELKYPDKIIKLIEDGTKIKLIHAIPYKHYDFCDESDDQPMVNEFTDFDVTIEVVHKNLKEAVSEKELQFVAKYFKDDMLYNEPGFIDDISIGSLKGYQITSQCEGCGTYNYYFILNSKNTLHIKRQMIPEVKSICGNHEEYLKLPGVISQEKEQEVFSKIITTFKLLE
ncbi:MAG: hypothetical protein PHE88_09910 [Elusimicrobia bacterium]|nr:hypothetical protein [Elusimicrobiota bacterium]